MKDIYCKIQNKIIVENEKREQERIEKLNNCNCGINKENLCLCKIPNYKLVKLSDNIFCINCNRLKCRC